MGQPVPPKLDGYDFVRFLGSGGFGDVFQYRHSLTNGSVAVKVLRDGVLDGAGRSQFEREAQALGTLSKEGSHPNIVTVHRPGEVDGRPYLMMEYCPAGSLVQKLRNAGRPMGPNEVMRLGVQIAGALHMAHEASIVHRDIKPGNILFGVGDIPKLGDFGIAAITSEEVASGSDFLSLEYAAPEVLQRGEADVLSDVFALGATLYEALAGHSWVCPPGADRAEAAMRQRIVDGVVPSIPGAPAQLDRLLRQAMTNDRRMRLPTAKDLADSLHSAQIALGYQPTPVPIYYDSPHQTVQRLAPMSQPETTARDALRFALVERQGGEQATGWRKPGLATELPHTAVRPGTRPPPPATESREQKPVPKRRSALIAVTVVTIVVAGLGVLALLRPDEPSRAPGSGALTGDPGDGALIGATVPTPKVTGDRVDQDSVKFTWTYDDPQPGDYFRLQRSEPAGAAVEQVEQAEWAADGVNERLCVVVRVIRADHRAGRETGEACA
jgi:serine/threonine protein kinase